ncbi:MAG: O-antigen ligase family protein, partial [Sedimenticola sp.]|nr:O-antigen ligase family protein [Sedimenticola sp.]
MTDHKTPSRQKVNRSYPLYPLFILSCIAIFVVLAPNYDLINWAMRYDEKRITQVLVILITAGFIISSREGTRGLISSFLCLPRISRLCLTTILLLGFISSVQSPAMRHAIGETSLFLLLTIFSLSLGDLTRNYQDIVLRSLLSAMITSAFIYEIGFFTSYIGILLNGHSLQLPEPFSGFSNYRFFNQYQIWTLPLVALPLLTYTKLFSSLRLLLVLLAIGWWVLLFASQSRGALLAIGLALVITFIAFRKEAYGFLKTTLLPGITGWLLYLVLFSYIPELEPGSRLSQLTEDPGRLELWGRALEMLYENPWFGAGPMHYAYYPNTSAAHPHNSLLQLAAEWGLPVAIITAGLACWGAIAWVSKYRRNANQLNSHLQQHLWIALFCSLIAGLIYSMVSGVIVTPLS